MSLSEIITRSLGKAERHHRRYDPRGMAADERMSEAGLRVAILLATTRLPKNPARACYELVLKSLRSNGLRHENRASVRLPMPLVRNSLRRKPAQVHNRL